MEYVLGVRLLDRTARGVEPTLYGRAMLKWAVVAFDDLSQSIKEIEFLADPTTGELRLGAPEGMMGGLLPAVIDHISQRHPRIVFHVVHSPSVIAQYQDLRERRVELIIGRAPGRAAEDDIDVDELFSERLFVVAGAGSAWLRRRRIALADLMGEPWCLPPVETIQGSLMRDAFQASGLSLPARRVNVFSLQLHASLLATGRYLSIFPSSVLHFGGKQLAVPLPVKLASAAWPVAVATLKKRTVSPVAQVFIDCARKLARSLSSRAS